MTEKAERWWKRVVQTTPFKMTGKNIWKHMDEYAAYVLRESLTSPLHDLLAATDALREAHRASQLYGAGLAQQLQNMKEEWEKLA